MLKGTINKKYTTLEKLDHVKNGLRWFCGFLDTGDIMRDVYEYTDGRTYGSEPVSVKIEAFPAGSFYGDDTVAICVDIVADRGSQMFKINVYYHLEYDGEEFSCPDIRRDLIRVKQFDEI